LAHRPLITALLFQVGLVALAVILAVIFGLSPLAGVVLDVNSLVIALMAVLPLAGGLILMPRGRWRWADRVVRQVETLLQTLFSRAWPGAVLIVSVLAGVGEELLFRGVIQDGLAGLLPAWIALVLASILFGLAHAVTLAYFVIATVIGLYLGALYWMTDNLFVPVVTHAVYDWIAIHFYLRRR
jgi:membrane protease YdiL (CAAX protease family)